MAKRRHGREQQVSGRPEALASVARVLDQPEAVWRGRVERMVDILGESGTTQDKTTRTKGEQS